MPATKPRNQHRRQWDNQSELAAFKKRSADRHTALEQASGIHCTAGHCRLFAHTPRLFGAVSSSRLDCPLLLRLVVGFKLDVFDTASVPPQWMEAEVTNSSRSSIDVHYIGWSDKYDTTVEVKEYPQRIAPLASYSEEVVHYSCCVVCDDGGDTRQLVCCDGCPRVVHLQCAKLRHAPKGDYFCPDCIKHKRTKRRVIKNRRDVSQYEEEEDEDEEEGQEQAEEREKENRSNRAGRRGAAAAPVKAPSRSSRAAARPASPAPSAAAAAPTPSARQTTARPSDRRALATKAGRSRLHPSAGLKRTAQPEAKQEPDTVDLEETDEDVPEETERKESPVSRKRARSDSGSGAKQLLRSGSAGSTTPAPTGPPNLFAPQTAPLPPVPHLAASPPIHLAAGVSSAANQSSRKRVRATSAIQQPPAQLLQPQPQPQPQSKVEPMEQDDSATVSPLPASEEEERKEPSVDTKRSAVYNFVDCYKYHAAKHGKSLASSSSSHPVASVFMADGLPASNVPPFSFPPSSFDEREGDAYMAHFCQLLDNAADKVALTVPSELPGVERYERMRDKVEEVGNWMLLKCNQQINGEQAAVSDNREVRERQEAQWKEQAALHEQRSMDAVKKQQVTTAELQDIDREIKRLEEKREEKKREAASRVEQVTQVAMDKANAQQEHRRRVTELQEKADKTSHRVRMLRDLYEHVKSRREEGDDRKQTGQFWEPLDTIRRVCNSMSSGRRLRDSDRSNSGGDVFVRKESSRLVEEERPADEQKEASKGVQSDIAAAVASCVDAAAYVGQSMRSASLRSMYQQSSFDDETFDDDEDEAAAELQSHDTVAPLDMRSSVFPTGIRLSSASFGSLSSLSSASTVSEAPQPIMSSSSDESVTSTQTTLPHSPALMDGAGEAWEAERQRQRTDEDMNGHAEGSQHAGEESGGSQEEEALPDATAQSELSNERRLSEESMAELMAVAEEQLTPEKQSVAVAATATERLRAGEVGSAGVAASVIVDGRNIV